MPEKNLILPDLNEINTSYEDLLKKSHFNCKIINLFGCRSDFRVLIGKKDAVNYVVFPLARDTRDEEVKEPMESYYLSFQTVKKQAEHYIEKGYICILPVAKWSLADHGGELPIATVFLSKNNTSLFDSTAHQEIQVSYTPSFFYSRSESHFQSRVTSELNHLKQVTLIHSLTNTDYEIFNELLTSNSLSMHNTLARSLSFTDQQVKIINSPATRHYRTFGEPLTPNLSTYHIEPRRSSFIEQHIEELRQLIFG